VYVSGAWVGAETLDRLGAIHLRHLYVHQDHIRSTLYLCECLESRLRHVAAVPLVLEVAPDVADVCRIVVHQVFDQL
jgi:hypothetical protein